jgi:hypothetical protein
MRLDDVIVGEAGAESSMVYLRRARGMADGLGDDSEFGQAIQVTTRNVSKPPEHIAITARTPYRPDHTELWPEEPSYDRQGGQSKVHRNRRLGESLTDCEETVKIRVCEGTE